jgi:hypothetical protein
MWVRWTIQDSDNQLMHLGWSLIPLSILNNHTGIVILRAEIFA